MFKRLFKLLIFAGCVFSITVDAAQYTIFPSTIRTATTTSIDLVRTTEVGAHFILVVSAVPGVDTVTMKIQGKDNLGNYYDVLIGPAVSTTGTTVLKLSPSIGSISGGAANDMLPDIYRIVITHSNNTNFTYTVTENTWGRQ